MKKLMNFLAVVGIFGLSLCAAPFPADARPVYSVPFFVDEVHLLSDAKVSLHADCDTWQDRAVRCELVPKVQPKTLRNFYPGFMRLV